MKKVVNVYKPVGKTPYEIVQKYKDKYPKYKDKKIGYAGRLDPMAEGVLLLLIEPETKNRDKYQNMDKRYEFEILFGISTDSYDILGIPQTNTSDIAGTVPTKSSHNLETKIQKLLTDFIGKITQKYPPYSSKPVNGKPLFWWAKKRRLNEITIPQKEINIYSLNLVEMREINTEQLSKIVEQKITSVSGDFRQEQIMNKWGEILHNNNHIYTVATIQTHCSSGTYVRSIAQNLGKEIGTGAFALSIKRTSVGNYKLNQSITIKS